MSAKTAIGLSVILLSACGESVELRDGGGARLDGSYVPPGDAYVPFEVDPMGRVLCGDAPCACDNGVDDDGDGHVDGADAECTGPYDDDESSFATGIPGDNIDFCQDCFFDGNSGHEDDDCEYHSDCLYGRTPPGVGMAGCFSCDVTTDCVNTCLERTPNGCDCFGCCGVRTADGVVNVYLSTDCSLENIDDADACPRCTPTTDCYNECGRCELCPGQTADDLPADCGMTYTCDGGEQVCSETAPCPAGYYCQLGCCRVGLI